MSLPFTLDGVDDLLVEEYSGFDRTGFARLIGVLGSGSSSGDEIIQSGALPLRQASLSGTLYTLADVDTIRGYSDAKDEHTFTDGDGVSRTVVVFEFTVTAYTGRWSWSMTLVETEAVGS